MKFKQSTSRIWTQDANSIFFGYNHYAKLFYGAKDRDESSSPVDMSHLTSQHSHHCNYQVVISLFLTQ